jgi:hypothetical protein
MGVIVVPVVAWEMLVIPVQLAGYGIERKRGIAVRFAGAERGTASIFPAWRATRVFGVGSATPQYSILRTGS